MRRVRQQDTKSQSRAIAPPEAMPADAAVVAMIQALIPLGLEAVEEALQQEVTRLAGLRYVHGDGHPDLVRWGGQQGSVFLADQKLAVQVPRVRDRAVGREVPLTTYHALQTPRAGDLGLFRRVLAGISTREYRAAAEAVPAAFGLARTSVSRRFIRASARKLAHLQERSLADHDWIALVLDGKTFAEDALVLALGVTATGEKRLLGLVQTASENKTVCAQFLRDLGARGFPLDRPLLVILDGAKGLRAAVHEVFGTHAHLQRCQWHKRENVVRHLPLRLQPLWRRKLQTAYEQPSYAAAHAALARCQRELRLVNVSAAGSLTEGFEETLTLHRLGVFVELGTSFKTTNLLESVMARVEARRHRVTHWRTSDQKHRWCAAALLALETQFRRIKGFRQLPLLARALRANVESKLKVAA
jgi:transposase-like protein